MWGRTHGFPAASGVDALPRHRPMGNQFWPNAAQMAQTTPVFPKSHSWPKVDDQPVLTDRRGANSNAVRCEDEARRRIHVHCAVFPAARGHRQDITTARAVSIREARTSQTK